MQPRDVLPNRSGVVAGVNDSDGVMTPWGHLAWLVGENELPGAESLEGEGTA